MHTATPSATPFLDALDDETRDLLTARHANCWSRAQPDHPTIEQCARDIAVSRSRAHARRSQRHVDRTASAAR